MAFDLDEWYAQQQATGAPPPVDVDPPDPEPFDLDVWSEGQAAQRPPVDVAPAEPADLDAILSDQKERASVGAPRAARKLIDDLRPSRKRPRPTEPALGQFTTPDEPEPLPTGAGFIAKETAKDIGRRVFVPLAKGGAGGIEAAGGLLNFLGLDKAGNAVRQYAKESRDILEDMSPTDPLVKMVDGKVTWDRDAAKNPENWTDLIITSLSSLSQAAAFGPGRGATGAALKIGALRAGAAAGILEAAPMFGDLRDQGMDRAEASARSVAFGIITSVLNKVSFQKMLGSKSVASVLVSAVTEGATEGTEEFAQVIAENIGRVDNPELLRELSDAIAPALQTAIGAAMAGGGGALVSARGARQASDAARGAIEAGLPVPAELAEEIEKESPGTLEGWTKSGDVYMPPAGLDTSAPLVSPDQIADQPVVDDGVLGVAEVGSPLLRERDLPRALDVARSEAPPSVRKNAEEILAVVSDPDENVGRAESIKREIIALNGTRPDIREIVSAAEGVDAESLPTATPPQRLFHGTPTTFSEPRGSTTGGVGGGSDIPGYFMAESGEHASEYAGEAEGANVRMETVGGRFLDLEALDQPGLEAIRAEFEAGFEQASVESGQDVSDISEFRRTTAGGVSTRAIAKAFGYDGVTLLEPNSKRRIWVSFKPPTPQPTTPDTSTPLVSPDQLADQPVVDDGELGVGPDVAQPQEGDVLPVDEALPPATAEGVGPAPRRALSQGEASALEGAGWVRGLHGSRSREIDGGMLRPSHGGLTFVTQDEGRARAHTGAQGRVHDVVYVAEKTFDPVGSLEHYAMAVDEFGIPDEAFEHGLWSNYTGDRGAEFVEFLKARGFDSAVVREIGDEVSLAVFSPEQVRVVAEAATPQPTTPDTVRATAEQQAASSGKSVRSALNEQADEQGVPKTGSNAAVAGRVAEARQQNEEVERELAQPDERAVGARAETSRADSEQTNKMRTRGLVRRLLDNPEIPDEIKKFIRNREYPQNSANVTDQIADAYIAEHGIEQAQADVLDLGNAIFHPHRVVIAQRVMSARMEQEAALRKDGRTEEAEAVAEQAGAVSDTISELGTLSGQTAERFKTWSYLTPAGAVAFASRKLRKAKARGGGETDRGISKPKSAAATRRINRATKRGAESAAPKVLKAWETDIIRQIAEGDADGGLWGKYRDSTAGKIASRVASRLSPAMKNNPALQEFVNRIERLAAGQLNLPPQELAKLSQVEKMRLIVLDYAKNRAKYRQTIRQAKREVKAKYEGRPELLAKIDDIFSGAFGTPFTEKGTQAVVKEVARGLGVDFRDVVTSHYKESRRSRADLAEEIVARIGVPESMAIQIRDAVREQINKETAAEKARIIKQYTTPKQAKESKSEIDRLIEYSNAGVLNDEAFRREYEKRLGGGKLTAENVSEINRRARAVQEAPEGRQRNDKIIDMLTYIDRATGKAARGDKLVSLWYANVLSGHQTQERNLYDTGVNVLSDVIINAVVNKQNPVHAVRAMLGGLRQGLHEGAETLATGRTQFRKDKLESIKGLESNPYKGRLSFLNKWKLVGRALSAEDALWYKAAQVARQNILARKLAKEQGLSGEALRKEVDNILHNTEQNIREFEAQAKTEGLTGRAAKLRAFELAEQQMPPDLLEDSVAFAGRATYNFEPEGVMGEIARGVEHITGNVPLLRFVVPFTRIVANVTNRNLAYTPIGGAMSKKKYARGDMSPEVYAEQQAKAIVGSLTMGALLMMSKMFDDEDDPRFAIYGRGPSDFKKRNQLRQDGWRPYSIKIGGKYIDYRLSPFALGLSFAGNLADAERFNEMDEVSMGDRTAFAAVMMGDLLLNQSFMSGAADVFSIFDAAQRSPELAAEKAEKFVARAFGGFIAPNLFRQIDQVFDPKLTEAKTFAEAIAKQIPFARREGRPLINALGEQVEKDTGLIFGKKKGDPIWGMLAEKGVWVPVPGRTSKLAGHTMTDEQYYDYMKASGELLKQRIEDNLGSLSQMDTETLQAWMKENTDANRKGSVRAQAKIEVAEKYGVVLEKTSRRRPRRRPRRPQRPTR